MFDVKETEFLTHLCAAALCGLIVGIDREVKRKPLGARTYVLVAVASAAWVMITINFSIKADEARSQTSTAT
ncbi:MAG: MgtC/SapB family protein [Roseobacter sp.]